MITIVDFEGNTIMYKPIMSEKVVVRFDIIEEPKEQPEFFPTRVY